jgi:membrane protein YdbS with pleckstrin-like domain
MQRFLFICIIAVMVMVTSTLLKLSLLAAEHSIMWAVIGFGGITLVSSAVTVWYAVQGYRFIKSPLMVKHQRMFTK